MLGQRALISELYIYRQTLPVMTLKIADTWIMAGFERGSGVK